MRIFIIVIITCLLFHFSSSAQIFYVAPNGTGDGTSWNNATSDLHSLLEMTSPGDEIWVVAGVYFPDPIDREASFVIPSGVAVYGGFTGMETSRTERDPLINFTILSGAIGATTNDDNSYSVIRTTNVNANTVVDGFIIEEGTANADNGGFENPNRAGGGWHNLATSGNESSPTINNCIFKNNYAFGFGGGLANIADYDATCNSLVSNCIFENNFCDNDGGGIFNSGKVNGHCQPQIIDCVFDNNTAENGGGAIYNHGQDGICSPIIDRCQILNNYAGYAGGGIYSFGKDGIADPQFSNCLIIGNIGQFGGGGIYNLGNGHGSASPTIVNCTFTLNSSVVGGAMYNNAGSANGTASPDIINCIFWNNPVSAGGSVFRANYGTPNISFSIVDEASCNDLNSGTASNVTCGPGMQFNINPDLTPTFGIPIGSPAINAGNNFILNSIGLTLDLNQNARIQNALADLGATETFSPDLDTDGDGITDANDNCPTIPNNNQLDMDQDNFGAVCDCDDMDAMVNDNATEICDGIDNNCDGIIDEGFDLDGDGFKTCEGDCDDADDTIFPGALEICDGIDNNCDNMIDEGAQPVAHYPDLDGDLLGDADATPSFDCPPLPGYIIDNTDCDDTNPSLPTTPGTFCSDGNPNTMNDMIQEDGCTCLGTPLAGYCASLATEPWVEWIENVSLNDLDNTSTKSQYSDFTNLVANVNLGTDYQFSLLPTFSYFHNIEYIQVWIDYNQNESFDDPGELVVSTIYENGIDGTTATPVTENISIPAGAMTGNTRMRVSMQRDQASGPCEVFVFGEVEDYTINLISSGPILSLDCSDNLTIDLGIGATTGIISWNDPIATTSCPDEIVNLLQTNGPINGTVQSTGTYTISYEATDNCGNIENCSFDITLESSPASLSLSCPSDQVISTIPGAATAVTTWTIPSPISDCPTGTTLLNQTAGLPPGNNFPIGINTITYEASDGCGNLETCSFTITVNDGGIPTLTLDCPANQTLTTLPGESTSIATWTTPVPTTNCPTGTTTILQTVGLPSGNAFPIGTNTITYEATDDCGNLETCSFILTVNDGGPIGNGYCESAASAPWIDWIGNVSLNDLNNPSNKSGYSDFTNLVANVDIGGNYQVAVQPIFSYTHFTEYIQVWIDFNQNESFADPGELVVDAVYTNGINGTTANPVIQNISIPSGAATGNTRMRVSMNRTEPAGPCELFEFGEVEDYTVNIINNGPILTLGCSTDLNISAGVGATNGVVNWQTPTFSSTCPTGTPTLTQTSGPANGSTQPLGIYTIAYEATDNCGNLETCSFTVTLSSDQASLSINCPANQNITTAAGSTTAIANWNTPTPLTTCPGGNITIDQIAGLPSGSDFPIGTTTITYEATDDCGNIETCSFTINVSDGGPIGNGYCASAATAPWEEWIGNVSLSDLDNTSGKNGYGDFTTRTANVIKGTDYTLSIQPVFSYTHFTEYFQVWIDFNGNENFNDPGELVISTIYENGVNGTTAAPIIEDITIPTNAPNGATRMRVTMSRNAAVGPCDAFTNGEVEDYTINIQPAPVSSIINSSVAFNLSAYVEARTVRLNWVTNLDAETETYTIERKGRDGVFSVIDQVASYDNTEQTHFYQYPDYSLTNGRYEYRVVANKHDGTTVFTNIQAVELGEIVGRLNVFPNPASSEVTLMSELLVDHSVNLMLTNSLGQIIHQEQYDPTADQRIILDVSNYPNGIYLVRFQTEKRKALHTRLVVERD